VQKLVLFDVDGTLLITGGVASRAFRAALGEVYGIEAPTEDYDFHGRTDPEIARDLLRLAGLAEPAIDEGLDGLWDAYLGRLAAELERADGLIQPLPGVLDLLSALGREDDHVVALLTGNIERGARLKLEAAGLTDWFGFGAYGSDHERRDRLPAVAVRRALERTGIEFRGRDIVIVGDTPLDVACVLFQRFVGLGSVTQRPPHELQLRPGLPYHLIGAHHRTL